MGGEGVEGARGARAPPGIALPGGMTPTKAPFGESLGTTDMQDLKVGGGRARRRAPLAAEAIARGGH